jgi:hypothetical protein
VLSRDNSMMSGFQSLFLVTLFIFLVKYFKSVYQKITLKIPSQQPYFPVIGNAFLIIGVKSEGKSETF